MRIAYGVHGYGRGHATRALTLLPRLTKEHEVMVLAGGDAFDLLRPEMPVERIPTLRYHYGKGTRTAGLKTLIRNLPAMMDVLLKGPGFDSICDALADFAPDVVISDADIWTHRAAQRLGVPRIGIDHYGILVYCRPDVQRRDWLTVHGQAMVYRWMMGQPERVIVSSFYPAPPRRDGVAVVGPLLRREVRETPIRPGEHVLVYLTKPQEQFTKTLEESLLALNVPVRVYGLEGRRPLGNLVFRPLSNLPFVEDLASCVAVISTAGNQLVGEAMHFRKPMFVMPEDTVEQRINAKALRRLGIGRSAELDQVTVDDLRAFLQNLPEHRRAIDRATEANHADGAKVLFRFLDELAGSVPKRRKALAHESV